jgi:hypothetical protein
MHQPPCNLAGIYYMQGIGWWALLVQSLLQSCKCHHHGSPGKVCVLSCTNQSLISGTGSFLSKPSVLNHHAVISASQSTRKTSGFFSPHPQPQEYWKSMNYKTPGCPQPLGGNSVSGVEVAVGRTPKGLSESQASEPLLCTRPAPLLPATATVPLSRSAGPQVFCTRLSFRRKCN